MSSGCDTTYHCEVTCGAVQVSIPTLEIRDMEKMTMSKWIKIMKNGKESGEVHSPALPMQVGGPELLHIAFRCT